MSPDFIASNGALKGFDALPGIIAHWRASGTLVELIEIMPTILDLCRGSIPADAEGRALFPLVVNETNLLREHVIAEYRR